MERRDTTRMEPDKWVGAYGDALLCFALARVKKSDVAEDLVQETYFAALRSQGSFRGHSSEKTWLFGILKHKVLDHFKKSPRVLLLNDVSSTPDGVDKFLNAHGRGWPPSVHPAADPEGYRRYRKLLDDMYRCLANLPQRAAQVFIYREIDGLSTEEICKLFGISRHNCWTILHRAKLRLRQRLRCYGDDPSA